MQRLPANEDVERGFSFKDSDQLGLKLLGGSQTLGGSGRIRLGGRLLVANPVAEIGIGKGLEHGVVEAMVVE